MRIDCLFHSRRLLRSSYAMSATAYRLGMPCLSPSESQIMSIYSDLFDSNSIIFRNIYLLLLRVVLWKTVFAMKKDVDSSLNLSTLLLFPAGSQSPSHATPRGPALSRSPLCTYFLFFLSLIAVKRCQQRLELSEKRER